MKRRLLSAFLAVMMVLTMAPVAFAADTATSDGEALSKLFTDVHAGESGSGNVTVTIDKDYDLTGYQWTSLTVQGYTGAGVVTVEGNNHKITGLNAPLFAGGFAGTSGIVVKNLTLTKVTIKDSTSNQGIGAFINNVDSMPKIELDNCHLTDSSIDSNGGARVGGLIGWTSGYNNPNDGPVDTYVTIQNCSVENTKITAKGSVGGIIGHAGANQATYHTFTNNTVTGCTLNSTDDGGWRVGVVVGTANVGEVALNNTTESGNTVTQTGKTAPAGQSNLYGRFVPGTTGKLVIDGTAVFDSSIVAVVDNKGYKTLADAVAAAQDGDTVKLLKDVTENVVIPAGKTVTLDLNGKNIKPATGCAIVNKGNLTVMGSGEVLASQTEMAAVANFPDAVINLNGGTYLSKYWYVLKNMGSMTIDGAVTVKPADSGNVSSLIDNGWYYSTDKVAGESVPAQADKASLTIKNGDFSGKSGEKSCSVVKNDDYGVLNISGGTFDSTTNTNATNAATILNWNIATISGGIFKGQYPISNGAFANDADKGQFTISGGTFTGSKTLFGFGEGGNGVGKITITDGNFAAPAFGNWGNAYKMAISGGYFTVDPSAYCVTGKTGVPSNRIDKYVWTVGEKSATKAEVATGEPTVDASKVAVKNEEDKALLNATKSALSSTEVEGNGIATAAAAAANNNTVTADETVVNQLKKATSDNTVTTENTNIVIQTYMDMTITGVDASSEKKTITVDIQPMYRTVATTADVKNGGEIVLKGDESKAVNAVQIGDPQKLTVSGETTVSIQLPNGFVTDETAKIFVQHKGYEYEATVTKDGNGVYTATFTNPHGFSPFTISMTSQAVAQIGETKYTSLQDAVNAVEANGTIEIVGGTSPYTGTANKTFTVSNKTKAEITVNGQKIAKDESYTFKYTPSSGSSSGGSSSGKTTYKVTTSAVNNGGVNASPSNAEKGATITLTLSPDKGYKLDKLTVTDGSGKSVSTVKKSDTVYTFTMPASAVKVGVSYVKATETPSKTTFNDVSANDWFASAVDYVTGKGMMNGTAANTFSPKANTTRGMVVTVLYRLENQPSTSAASFTDVASGAYYANAVAWANANGIVSGYGSGKFGPNDKVTREQLAAILYRYAQYKKYDVSGANSLDGYTDVQSVSSYAVPALQWANAAGVVTGKSGSKLDPKGYATRAEVAAMLMRFCENVEK